MTGRICALSFIPHRMSRNTHKGFTLIELLIVIGIIAFLAAIILVAVDPRKRLAQARDARRWSEVNSILNAVLKYAADNEGDLPAGIDNAPGTAQILGTAASGCNVSCAVAGTTTTSCADLDGSLVQEYIVQIPIDPKGNDNTYAYDSTRTGYYINKTSQDRIAVGACNPERVSSIFVQR